MSRSALLLTLAALTLLPSIAAANDAVFGGDGATLAPIEEKDIKMVSEDILIEKVGKKGKWAQDHWQIKATYVFENPTDTSKTVTIGFPEATCDEGSDCNSQDGKSRFTFHGMKTRVDGKPVKVKVGKVSQKSSWAAELDRVHLFEVTMKPGKKTTIVHEYEMGESGSSMQDEWMTYVTKTGALWNGPIGSARFTVRLQERPWGFSYPEDYTLTSYETTKSGKAYKTDIVFEMKDWTPKQDLNMTFGSAFLEYGSCPSLVQTTEGSPEMEELRAQLASASAKTARICRNLPYARHGYTFKDAELNAHFYPTELSRPSAQVKDWPYRGYVDTSRGPFRVVTFAPSKAYSPSMLTKNETRWVKAIKEVEKKKK